MYLYDDFKTVYCCTPSTGVPGMNIPYELRTPKYKRGPMIAYNVPGTPVQVQVLVLEYMCVLATCNCSQHNLRSSRTHLTMIARRAVARFAPNAQRSMSTATPKTHKAKDVWTQIEATRPKDPHPHVGYSLLLSWFFLWHIYIYIVTCSCNFRIPENLNLHRIESQR